jgi:hypothetical protein
VRKIIKSKSNARNVWLNLLFLGVTILWVLIRSGTGIYPDFNRYFEIVLIWPDQSPAVFEKYLSNSPLGILIAKSMGIHAEQHFLIANIIAILLAFFLMATWAFRLSSFPQRWRSARMAVLAPVGGVLVLWIGFYDSFTVLAWLLVLFSWMLRSRLILASAGVILGFQHFEHATIGLLILTISWVGLRDRLPETLRDSNPLFVLPGLLAGRLLLEFLLRSSGDAGGGRYAWVTPFLREWTTVGANIAPQLLWSLFGGFWILVISLILTPDWQKLTRQNICIALAISIGLLATFLSGDRPRIFILVLFPTVLLMILAYSNTKKISTRERRVVETLLWIAPPLSFWGKEVTNANIIDLWAILIQSLA